MDFSNERYVRVYTRDTPGWCLLSWEARSVFVMLQRVVDRAGVLETGRDGTKAIAALIRFPLEVVDRAVSELLLDPSRLLQRDGLFVIPDHLDAQEAKQSDKVRQQESRARRLAIAMESVTPPVKPSRRVTKRHDPSHAVTAGHTPSQPVTISHDPSHAVTLAVPIQTSQTSLAEPETTLSDQSDVAVVFEHWRTVMGHPRSILDPKRKRLIREKLREGHSVETLKEAISGFLKSPHHMGQNDRHTRFDSLELLIGDQRHIDMGLGFGRAIVDPQRGMFGNLAERYPVETPPPFTKKTEAP